MITMETTYEMVVVFHIPPDTIPPGAFIDAEPVTYVIDGEENAIKAARLVARLRNTLSVRLFKREEIDFRSLACDHDFRPCFVDGEFMGERCVICEEGR